MKAILAFVSSAALALSWTGRLLAADSLEALSSRDGLSGLRDSLRSLDPSGDPAVPAVPAPRAVELPDGTLAIPLGAMTVYFANVGQGDATYIELPNGKNVLIDGGPKMSALKGFLKDRGATRIDHVVLTHPHADHYTGLKYAFKRLEVANFYDTRVNNPVAVGDETVRRLAAEEPGCKTSYPAPGTSLAWSAGVSVKVLHACSESGVQITDGFDLNNCSMVLKVVYQGVTLLFTGDIMARTEKAMVARWGAELKADVLKVPHHGSRESSTAVFLEKVRPSRAYISVGPDNNYGHPTPEAIQRLHDVGATVFRTDKDGTLSYAVGEPLRRDLASITPRIRFVFQSASFSR